MNNKIDIESIAIDLEQASNLLNCFYEFCEEESNISNLISLEEKSIAAISFANRMRSRRSLLFVSEEILRNNLEKLNSYLSRKD